MSAANGVEKRLLGPPRTAHYRPTVIGMPLSGWNIVGGGAFTLAQVRPMRKDPQVRLCLRYRMAPIRTAEFLPVESKNPEVAQFVGDTIQRLWRRSLPVALECLPYGYSASEVLYKKRKRFFVFDRLKYLSPRDVRLHTRHGEPDFIRVKSGGGDQHGGSGSDGRQIDLEMGRDDRPAKGFWIVHEPLNDPYYGLSVLDGAWLPWRLKTLPAGGGMDAIAKWYYRHAYRGYHIRYPDQTYQDAGDAAPLSAQDLARQMMESLKTGADICTSSARDDKGNLLWEIDSYGQVNGSGSDMIAYVKDFLDVQIQRGMDIPDGIVTESSVGGYAGRKIPEDAFYVICEEDLNVLVEDFDDQVIRPLVRLNFGDVSYVIRPKPLLPIRQQAAQTALSTPPPGGDAGGSPPPPSGGGAENPLAALLGTDSTGGAEGGPGGAFQMSHGPAGERWRMAAEGGGAGDEWRPYPSDNPADRDRPRPGRQGQQGWKNRRTGRIVWGPDRPKTRGPRKPIPGSFERSVHEGESAQTGGEAAAPPQGTGPLVAKRQRGVKETAEETGARLQPFLEHIKGLQATLRELSPEDRRQHIYDLAHQLVALTVPEITHLKKVLQISASGKKSDLAMKVAERALSPETAKTKVGGRPKKSGEAVDRERAYQPPTAGDEPKRDSSQEGKLPDKPTRHRPGTPEYIEELSQRFARGEQIFHPEDPPYQATTQDEGGVVVPDDATPEEERRIRAEAEERGRRAKEADGGARGRQLEQDQLEVEQEKRKQRREEGKGETEPEVEGDRELVASLLAEGDKESAKGRTLPTARFEALLRTGSFSPREIAEKLRLPVPGDVRKLIDELEPELLAKGEAIHQKGFGENMKFLIEKAEPWEIEDFERERKGKETPEEEAAAPEELPAEEAAPAEAETALSDEEVSQRWGDERSRDEAINALEIGDRIGPSAASQQAEEREKELIDSYSDWRESLSPEESSAFDDYMSANYRVINNLARHGENDPALKDRYKPEDIAKAKETMALLDSAIARSRLPRDLILYRQIAVGSNSRFGRELARLFDAGELGAGAEYREDGFVSTTHAANVIGEYNYGQVGSDDPIFAQILAPAGTAGALISAGTAGKEQQRFEDAEHEIVLPRQSTFRVRRSWRDEQGRRRLEVDLVPKETAGERQGQTNEQEEATTETERSLPGASGGSGDRQEEQAPARTEEVAAPEPKHVLDAFDQLDKGSNLVSLVDLRKRLAEAGIRDRAQQDKALLALWGKDLTFSAIEGRHGSTEEERAAAIKDQDGTLLGFVSRKDHATTTGKKPKPEAVPPAPKAEPKKPAEAPAPKQPSFQGVRSSLARLPQSEAALTVLATLDHPDATDVDRWKALAKLSRHLDRDVHKAASVSTITGSLDLLSEKVKNGDLAAIATQAGHVRKHLEKGIAEARKAAGSGKKVKSKSGPPVDFKAVADFYESILQALEHLKEES